MQDLTCPLCGADAGELHGTKTLQITWLANHLYVGPGLATKHHRMTRGAHALGRQDRTWHKGPFHHFECWCGFTMKSLAYGKTADGDPVSFRTSDGARYNMCELFIDHVRSDPEHHSCLQHLYVPNREAS